MNLIFNTQSVKVTCHNPKFVYPLHGNPKVGKPSDRQKD